MGIYRIRKMVRFEAAHQLESAFSRACVDCIHGHSYKLEVFFVACKLDRCGMVLDFGEVKEMLNKIVATWDHALILPPTIYEIYKDQPALLKTKVICFSCNPTAEAMAEHVYEWISTMMANSVLAGRAVRLEKVRIHETETGWAEYEGGSNKTLSGQVNRQESQYGEKQYTVGTDLDRQGESAEAGAARSH